MRQQTTASLFLSMLCGCRDIQVNEKTVGHNDFTYTIFFKKLNIFKHFTD